MSTLMSEGVGKRIVDALKMQNELEIVDKTQIPVEENVQSEQVVSDMDVEDVAADNVVAENDFQAVNSTYPSQTYTNTNYNNVNAMGTPVSNINNYQVQQNNTVADFSNQDVPQNVAILKQLISQLPGGVSRQAGALVIKQTMEALGISMKSVLQEAQQLQESINLSSRECQSSILECKKQINNLELQVQQYQKQSSSLNDIISLFVQIN